MKGILYAADVLFRGGVIAYPTEGVYGLGCLPDDVPAVRRVIGIKRRDASKGLILIAASAAVRATSRRRRVQTKAISAVDPSLGRQ